MGFADEMLEELNDYAIENGADVDADLNPLAIDLDCAIQAGDDRKARWLAREGRRYLIANGYADEDEIAQEQA